MKKQMCTVKPYNIFSRKIWTICHEASLPFLGEMDCWVVA